jgi:hypothetical protein
MVNHDAPGPDNNELRKLLVSLIKNDWFPLIQTTRQQRLWS